MHVRIAWAEKDQLDQSFKSGQKKDAFVGCTRGVFEVGQPPALHCDVSSRRICTQPLSVFNRSYSVVETLQKVQLPFVCRMHGGSGCECSKTLLWTKQLKNFFHDSPQQYLHNPIVCWRQKTQSASFELKVMKAMHSFFYSIKLLMNKCTHRSKTTQQSQSN